MRRRRREAAVSSGDPATTAAEVGDSTGRPLVPGARVTPANPLTDPDFVAGLRPVPSGIGDAPVAWSASDVSGEGPDGQPVGVDLGVADRRVLLVFLSTNCDGCDLFWTGLRDDLPSGVDVVVVTKGPATVAADEVVAAAVGVTAPIVMTDRAWADFRVTSYPFLVLVEPRTRRILGESVGFGWSDVAALLDGGGNP